MNYAAKWARYLLMASVIQLKRIFMCDVKNYRTAKPQSSISAVIWARDITALKSQDRKATSANEQLRRLALSTEISKEFKFFLF